ncbi:patatin-like phospholipase family protein [Halarcobacter anaerophilus]|uniref:Patatin n=1 Tax=Halarcobacter anaerophilus TaxID=877500 RepID=A0A4Q0XW33_9BACT|nr:patatin-like phospholipase family protein [Halarcobacter anaerophilus]QDF30323.1 Patatin-like phospholipase [Halarcobacter anaerophilus]RXJ61175.1 patatin [Halarcobacter anaerophilus]
MSDKKFAVALGGGAAKGAFHLGILHFMEESRIEIDAYSGSSIGAIISASHASGVKAKEQLKIFSSQELKDILKFNYFRNGLIRIQREAKLLDHLLPIKQLEKIPKKVYVCAYDLKKRKLHYFDKGDTQILCMASSALVPLFEPVNYKNMYLIDGGLFDSVPIKPLNKEIYEILAIDLFPSSNILDKKKMNPFKILKKKFFTQLYENHIFTIKNTDQYLTTLKLKDFSMFTFKQLDECFNLGYKEAKKHFLKAS